MRTLPLVIARLCGSACQCKTGLRLEQKWATLLTDVKFGGLSAFVEDDEAIDRELRLERGRINGKTSPEARAEAPRLGTRTARQALANLRRVLRLEVRLRRH